MLAAAPPKSRRVRRRTSANTNVSPSRAMMSISPRRQRKLRSRMTRPRATRNAAAAELHQPSLADELARRIEREMARRAVELELQGCSVRERMGHAECVHSERVEALERWIGIVGTLLVGECHA